MIVLIRTKVIHLTFRRSLTDNGTLKKHLLQQPSMGLRWRSVHVMQDSATSTLPGDTSNTFAWYALKVRACKEKYASNQLRQRGFEDFLPLYTERRRWSDRWRDVELAFFPGYVFCRFDPSERLAVLGTPGVLSVVGNYSTPKPIPPREIDNLRIISTARAAVSPWPYLGIGTRVVVLGGALRGVEGILVSQRSGARVVVSVNLLQRSLSLEIDAGLLAAV